VTIRRAIGCMTGTSIDGIDCALVEIEGRALEMNARFMTGHSAPLGEIGTRVRALASGQAMTAHAIAARARELALLHIQAIEALLRKAAGGPPSGASASGPPASLVCVHGQTVFHAPPLSWQLLNPAPIAHALNVPVVFDLRAADLAAGGQGAPITPIADFVLFRDAKESRLVVNLGGYCNVTYIPAGPGGPHHLDAVRGRDLCACNQVIDAVARAALGAPFDEDGAAAARGQPDEVATRELVELLIGQVLKQRSLGSGDELSEWVERHRTRCRPEDLARSACTGVAGGIFAGIMKYPGPVDLILICGGGARNKVLWKEIARAARPVPIRNTSNAGIPGEYREAACFAVLGALCEDRVPITLPQVTGVRAPAPISGCWIRP